VYFRALFLNRDGALSSSSSSVLSGSMDELAQRHLD
jgi:hypothetical protein